MRRFHFENVSEADAARFRNHILVASDMECWLWTGMDRGNGYGGFFLNGETVAAHRLAYYLANDNIDIDMVVDHICRNRKCCNPKHLRLVTNKENVLAGIGHTALNARKTHCKRGHPLSGDNLYTLPKGGRVCRTCVRASWRRRNPPKAGDKR